MTASELTENPMNWRTHDQAQLEALDEVLGKVGWAGTLLYNLATNRLIDGHARLQLRKESDEKLPVLVGTWTEEQERLILATLDPIASKAGADTERLKALLDSLHEEEDSGIGQLLRELQDASFLDGESQPEPPSEFPEVSESTIETDHECPKCGYVWSGSSSRRSG